MNRLQRVVMISPFLDAQRGNALTARRLQRGLIEKGYNVELISSTVKGANTYEQEIQGPIDLVHGLHILQLARYYKTHPELEAYPMIITATGTDLNCDLSGPEQALMFDVLTKARALVVFHHDFDIMLRQKLPGFETPVAVIPQGVYLEDGKTFERSDLGLDKDDFVYMLPSGLRSIKGIFTAIDALEEMHKIRPNTRLLMAGSIIDRQYAEEILAYISDKDWVVYAGEQAHQDMKGLYKLADVVLNTSLAEGQPQAVLEAMSLGIPCILSAVPGNQGIIQHGREGFYAKQEKDIFEQALYLQDNKEKRLQMGQAAMNLIKSVYSYEREVMLYHQLYGQIMNDNKAKGECK